MAVTVAGLVEYAFSAQQLERRIVEESTAGYLAEVHDLEEVLAADLAPQVRQQQVKEELERWGRPTAPSTLCCSTPRTRS